MLSAISFHRGTPRHKLLQIYYIILISTAFHHFFTPDFHKFSLQMFVFWTIANPCSLSVAHKHVRIVYFLSFFSPFAKKTLTNFNIHTACFVNYKGLASAENTHNFSENTHNFSENTNNFSFSPNIFSDSPSNFTDFPAIFGIKRVEIPRFTRVSPLPYYKDNKFSSEMQIR